MTFNFPEPDRPPVPAITIEFLERINTIRVSNAKDHPDTALIMHGLAEKSWTVNVTPDESWFSVYDRAATSRKTMLLLKAAIEEAYEVPKKPEWKGRPIDETGAKQ